MTRSVALCEAFRQLLPRDLHLSVEPNATALGAAILAAVGAGLHADLGAGMAAMVRTRALEPGGGEAWEAHYAKWRELYALLHAQTV